jgi:hypothetical protein
MFPNAILAASFVDSRIQAVRWIAGQVNMLVKEGKCEASAKTVGDAIYKVGCAKIW